MFNIAGKKSLMSEFLQAFICNRDRQYQIITAIVCGGFSSDLIVQMSYGVIARFPL